MESSENRIIDRILNDAREEAATIVKDAQKSAETIIEKQRKTARHNAEKEVYSLLKRAENEADIIRGKVSTDIKRRAGWIVLSEKDRLITSVLTEAKNKLVNMQNSKEYFPILEKLIVDSAAVLDGGILEVLLNKKDSALPLKLDKLEKEISDRIGVKTQLKFSDQHITAVGVIVKTVDERIFVNNTFEVILSRRERELRLKIAQILFSNVN
jgi:V/A-type H+/Na+-transporting ATPase subunit E